MNLAISKAAITALCLAMLTTCGQEDFGKAETAGIRTAIRPTADVGINGTLPAGPLNETSFPAATEGVFAVTAYRTDKVHFDNQPVNTAADGSLSFAVPQYYPANGDKLRFYAYSPTVGSDNYTAGTETDGPTVRWQLDGLQDLLWSAVTDAIGQAGQGEEQVQPQFKFRHLLKQVRFKLVQGEGFDRFTNAQKISITNCHPEASLNLVTGELSVTGELTTAISISGSYAIQPDQTASVISKSLLCEVGETETQLDIAVEVGNVTFKTSVTLPGGAGLSHLITLVFNATHIKPQASIVDWDTVGEVEGDITTQS